MGDVILVSSEKREIGKSILCIKTGIELSKTGKNVLLIDVSSGNKKISEYLKVNENIIYDIKDVLDNTCSTEQAVINIKENLNILPYPRIANKLGNIKREAFTKIVADIKKNYDIIIIDVDSLSSCYYVNFENIDGAIFVNNNDFSAVKEINNEFYIADKFGIKKTIVVINRYNKKYAKKGSMINLKELKKMISLEIIDVIEENIKYNNAEYDFLFNIEKNSFNNTIENIIKIL